MKKELGFTLVEIMIVVGIIAILAVLALPAFSMQTKKAKDANALKILSAVRSSLMSRISDHATDQEIYPLTITDTAIYFDQSLLNLIEFSDIDYSDNITKMEVQAGTVINGSNVSIGTTGKLIGKRNVVEFSYNNQTGVIIADGVGGVGYVDTKDRLWNIY